MAKLYIDGRFLSKAAIEELRALLIAADCDPDDVVVIQVVPDESDDSDEEVVVCVLSPEFLADPELEPILLRTIATGRRVIGVWPQGSANVSTPTAVIKYFYSVVPWDPDRMREVAPNVDCICFQTPEGDALEMPDPERRICP